MCSSTAPKTKALTRAAVVEIVTESRNYKAHFLKMFAYRCHEETASLNHQPRTRDGNLYDVQFLDGSCISLFNGCDDVSDFTFQTQAAAILASQALLDQVLLDGGGG